MRRLIARRVARAAVTFLADESGKISIVSIPVVAFIGIMIAFLVNTGSSVQEKIRLQTAADAGAATTTLWMARSMNAVTATNHLLGETTAVLVIFDGFGGPMLYEMRGDDGMPCEDSTRFNVVIKEIGKEAAITSKGVGAMAVAMAPADQAVITFVTKLVTKDNGKHAAGAAIYDAKLTLKNLLADYLLLKRIANVGIEVGAIVQKVPPVAPLGFGIEGASVAAHLLLTAEIVKIGKEWAVLESLEKVVATANRATPNGGGLITSPIEKIVIPGLCLHADTVLGRAGSGQAGKPPMARAIEASLRELAESHRVESLTVMPAPGDVRLPLVVEPPSPAAAVPAADKPGHDRMGPWEQPRSNAWQGEFPSDDLAEVRGAIDKVREPMNRIYDALDPLVKPFRNLSKELKKFAPSWLDDGIELLDVIGSARGWLPPAEWKAELNPCYVDSTAARLRVPKFHWKAESRSQWVRATHPYVDDLRAGIVQFLREQAPLSQAATHYVHWTDRYTLVRAHALRAERNPDAASSNREEGPLVALLAEVRKLKERFRNALAVDADEAPDVPADFEAIADDLLETVRRVGGTIEVVRDWLDRVSAMPGEIGSAGAQAAASPPDDIDPEDARALAEQLTRIAMLEELLSLAEKLADLVTVGPPHMYVIEGMDGTNKGDEPWTTDPQLAGRMFGVLATAEATPQPRLLDRLLFHTPSGRRVAHAGALVANGNGIRAGASSRSRPDAARQVDTGWDTLNWEPTVEAWEWGDHPPRDRGPFPVQALTGNAEAGRKARVRLGWDGLLVPIEGYHLRERRPATAGKPDPWADFSDFLAH